MSNATGQVWFAIPSASVERCRAVLPAWRERGYKLAVLQNREFGDVGADAVVRADAYPGWAASVNALCREVVPKHAAAVVTGGDDMLPDPHHSAADISRAFCERFPDGFGVMQPTGDGFLHAGEYCGSPWLGRGWIERAFGGRGPMPTGYRHNWADHELRWVARGHHALWLREDLAQRHEHFSRSGETPPAYWVESVGAHDEADCRRFIARSWLGFPGAAALGGTYDHTPFEREYTGVAETHLGARYGVAPRGSAAGRARDTVARTLATMAERGVRRVAIFGAGNTLAQAVATLRTPPVEIIGVIDEHPASDAVWGWPILSVAEARQAAPDAIVLCVRGEIRALRARLQRDLPLIDIVTPFGAGSTQTQAEMHA